MRSRRLVTTVLSTALIATLLAAVPGPAPSAQAAESDDLSVSELDLDGVDEADLATLPDPQSVPTEEGADVPAPEVQRSAETAPDAPEPTTEPQVQPTTTPGATAAPTDAPVSEHDPETTPDVLTAELDTADFSVLGVTWDRSEGLSGVQIRYRVRQAGEWTEWSGLESSDIGPDDGSDDADSSGARDGTDPIVAVGADGVQIWAEAETGTVTGLKAVLIDPGSDPADVGATVDGTGSTASSTTADTSAVFQNLGTASDTGTIRTAAVAQPGIISRAGWGADESLRGCSPDYSRTMVSAAVHHTASANGYSAEAVPGIIRGFYAYHTRPEAAGGRGWCDIGYNFLVDQYGRIFEGRAGGITSTVVGVHTGGFNSRTIGVAAIGDYSTYGPSGALAESISQLIAWKFAVHRIQANTSVTMTSGGGASKYPAGTVVTFPTIYAHRDAALTSCPGQALYNLLPDIRNRVAQLANATVAASPRWSIDSMSAGPGGIAVRGWAFDPESNAALPIRVSVDGAVTTLTADQLRADVASAYQVTSYHGFSGTVPAGNGTHLVCLTIGNVGAGQDVVAGCDWLTVRNTDPIGSLDSISTTPTSISLRGWALDPDTSASIRVHVYVDGKGAASIAADQSRPDVGRAYGKGDAHGFATTIPATGGTHQVCVYLINQPAGSNPTLDCRTVTVGTPPIGTIDKVSTATGTVTLSGWALDPDTTDPIRMHVAVDGTVVTAVTADQSRPDVGRAKGLGDNHGYSVTVPVAEGRHRVCLYLINVPSGPNPLLACREVTVRNAAPFGVLDSVRTTAAGAELTGWALDPDTTDPIRVHVYVDGKGAQSLAADRSRPDLDRAYGLGADHGFSTTVPLTAGSHQICLYLINSPTGSNPRLTCRDVTITNAAPVGVLDQVTTGTGTVRVRGWALDPDVAAPLSVHVYLDGHFVQRVSAADQRSDVARVHGTDGRHGFDLDVDAAAGPHELCVYALNQPTGPSTTLGCRQITVGG